MLWNVINGFWHFGQSKIERLCNENRSETFILQRYFCSFLEQLKFFFFKLWHNGSCYPDRSFLNELSLFSCWTFSVYFIYFATFSIFHGFHCSHLFSNFCSKQIIFLHCSYSLLFQPYLCYKGSWIYHHW